MTPSDIVVEDVSKRYQTPTGPVVALGGVALRVGPGASLGVVGPSGCGKSTLLALIAGLELPDSGRIVVEGRVVSSLTEAERACLRRERFGVVFQRDNLLPFLTAVENVALQLALQNERERFERCLEMLGHLGVADAADKLPDQLSGGQRQRVAVATHDLDLAARLDAVVQLRDGRIADSGRISRPTVDPPAGSPGQARRYAP